MFFGLHQTFFGFSTFRVFRFPATVAYATHGNSKIRNPINSKIRIFTFFGLHQIFPNFRFFWFFAFQPPLRTRHTAIRKFENSKIRKFEFSRFSVYIKFFRIFDFSGFSLSSHRCVRDTRQFENRLLENSIIRIFACFGLHQISLIFDFSGFSPSLRARDTRQFENSNFRVFPFPPDFSNFRLFGFFAFQSPLRARHTKPQHSMADVVVMDCGMPGSVRWSRHQSGGNLQGLGFVFMQKTMLTYMHSYILACMQPCTKAYRHA